MQECLSLWGEQLSVREGEEVEKVRNIVWITLRVLTLVIQLLLTIVLLLLLFISSSCCSCCCQNINNLQDTQYTKVSAAEDQL